MSYTPEKVARLCDIFLAAWPATENGPAHVVLSDYNFETEFIENCLHNIKNGNQCDGQSVRELMETAGFLEALLTIPEAERVFPDPEPVTA